MAIIQMAAVGNLCTGSHRFLLLNYQINNTQKRPLMSDKDIYELQSIIDSLTKSNNNLRLCVETLMIKSEADSLRIIELQEQCRTNYDMELDILTRKADELSLQLRESLSNERILTQALERVQSICHNSLKSVV